MFKPLAALESLPFLWAKAERLQLRGDSLCHFAFDGKNVGELTIVLLRPHMRVSSSIDQLRAHAHVISERRTLPSKT